MAKAVGIIRRLDDLGRIVLPIELRKNLGIEIGSPLEIFTEDKSIVLKKYEPIICENCGRHLEETDKFCRYCGRKL